MHRRWNLKMTVAVSLEVLITKWQLKSIVILKHYPTKPSCRNNLWHPSVAPRAIYPVTVSWTMETVTRKLKMKLTWRRIRCCTPTAYPRSCYHLEGGTQDKVYNCDGIPLQFRRYLVISVCLLRVCFMFRCSTGHEEAYHRSRVRAVLFGTHALTVSCINWVFVTNLPYTYIYVTWLRKICVVAVAFSPSLNLLRLSHACYCLLWCCHLWAVDVKENQIQLQILSNSILITNNHRTYLSLMKNNPFIHFWSICCIGSKSRLTSTHEQYHHGTSLFLLQYLRSGT